MDHPSLDKYQAIADRITSAVGVFAGIKADDGDDFSAWDDDVIIRTEVSVGELRAIREAQADLFKIIELGRLTVRLAAITQPA